MINYISSIAAITLFAFYDYIGYNTIKPTWIHRVFQAVLYLGICVWLYLIAAGSGTTGDVYLRMQVNIFGVYINIRALAPVSTFIILQWTWWADLVYYLFFDTLQWYHPQYAGKAFTAEVMNNTVWWAWWTPYGLVARLLPGKKDVPLSWVALTLQAIIGWIVAVIVLVSF